MPDPLSVCYFGAYRPDYPRNLTIRRALRSGRVPVAECRVPPRWPTWRRWPVLAAQFLSQKAARSASVILVAEFSHTAVPLAWALSRLTGAALVFDPGISFYDEMILSQGLAAERSPRARYLGAVDALGFGLADLVIWFTPVDAEHFGQVYRIPAPRTDWLPPGVDETLFAYSPPPESESPFIVHWDGSFIASHGVDVILDAARLLADLPDVRFELIGDGPTAAAMKARAQSLQLANVSFAGRVSAEALADSVRRAHVCLGAFRADDKQRRSLYTKELQAMLAGRVVVTAQGEAKRRLFTPDRELCLIPPDSPADLAQALRALHGDPAKRNEIGAQGHAAVRALCTSSAILERLLALLIQALANRRAGHVGQKPARPL